METNSKLTVKEALTQGFKYALWNEQHFTNCQKIETLNQADFEYAETYHNGLILCTKEVSHYGLSDDQIENLITDHIDSQDEFDDEDGELSGIALDG